jgi:2-polyprenyl-6-methoxyphenol hydroxylase-like FAD-dependent oxidoreductase
MSGRSRWPHAVVVGGGVAGLLAARALANHFDRVTLFERDEYPGPLAHRRGVPQGRHVHGVLAQGLVVLDELLPGLTDEMTAGGAIPFDWGRDLQWYYFGGYKPRRETGTRVLLFTRPYLETHLVRRLQGLGNVELRVGVAVEGLLTSADRSTVTGIQVRPVGGELEDIAADLVVDASGRGSRSPRWLAALGYPAPATTEIGIDVRYVSRFYRRGPNDLPGTTVVYVVPKPPEEKRGGAALQVEGDRWLVTLWGYFAADHPPTDDAGFLDFARSLPAPDVHQLISRLEPLTESVAYSIPVSVRHHYASMKRFPENYVLVGDAVSAFNPVFAQGMTVAALEVQKFDRTLADARRRGDLKGVGRAFMRRQARLIELPWRMAGHEDFRYPQTKGRRTFGTSLANRYSARMQKVSEHDFAVYRAFLQAMHMTRSPFVMFKPSVVLRVLRGPRRVTRPDRAAAAPTST